MKRYTKKCAIWHAKNLAKSFGFTLAELLVSVLIISIIMVVLAPVITKRVTSNINVSGSGGGSGSSKQDNKLFVYNPTDPDCSAVAGQNALDCNFTTGSGVKSVNVVMVSGGGGGAGGTPPTTEYGKKLTVTNSTIGSAKTQEITITKNMKNVVVSYLSGSGGGGGGGAWNESAGAAPTSQADCDKYDAKFLTASQNGGTAVCVTKYNIGDIPSATNGGIATSVTTVSTNTTCSANACCWQGKTASPCNSSGTSYSGCNRTVCTWYAGNASCQALAYNGTKAGDWRLPTEAEMSKWKSNINTINKNKGDNGLRLCDNFSGYGAAQCLISYVCAGANNDDCCPYGVWSSTPTGSDYYFFFLHGGSFAQYYDGPRAANSVRCVLEGGATTYNSYGGGGGSAGGYFKNYQIPESVITNNIGGKIVLYSAPGAKGGNKASSKGANASNGSSGTVSYIAIYNKSGQQVWGLEASGGNGGKGATSTAGGSGGASISVNSCKIFQNGSWTNTSCSGVGGAGNNGASLDTGGNGAANGGVGGGSMYNTTTLSGGGNGGSSSSVNGGNGSLYGSGGGGGTTKVVSDVATAGAGGKGANGVAEITYDLTYDPAAGGGGGGGAMLKVENITVTPSTNYVIRVGGGGNGGAVANNGSNGGESKVTFGSVSYSLSGGKGGTAGTSASATASVVHGVGGNGASKLSAGTSVAGTKGSDGSAGDIGAIGGNGGKSGVESEGGCGALFDNGGSCSATGAYGLSPLFVSPSNVFDAADYGKAGAGGGGGGYAYNTTMYPTNNPGYGGNGQNGYVYLYWTEYN